MAPGAGAGVRPSNDLPRDCRLFFRGSGAPNAGPPPKWRITRPSPHPAELRAGALSGRIRRSPASGTCCCLCPGVGIHEELPVVAEIPRAVAEQVGKGGGEGDSAPTACPDDGDEDTEEQSVLLVFDLPPDSPLLGAVVAKPLLGSVAVGRHAIYSEKGEQDRSALSNTVHVSCPRRTPGPPAASGPPVLRWSLIRQCPTFLPRGACPEAACRGRNRARFHKSPTSPPCGVCGSSRTACSPATCMRHTCRLRTACP